MTQKEIKAKVKQCKEQEKRLTEKLLKTFAPIEKRKIRRAIDDLREEITELEDLQDF